MAVRAFALVLAFLLTACGSTVVTAPSPTPTPTASPTPSPVPSPVTSAKGAITLRSPLQNATLTGSVRINGDASVFEANLQWRIVDSGGRVLADGITTASQGAPGRGDFSVIVAYTVPRETAAFVEVYSRSLKDGNIDEIVRVPVTLR
jgi:hypothetical protein